MNEWAKTWQAEFNVGKGEARHFSMKHQTRNHYLNEERLQMSEVV